MIHLIKDLSRFMRKQQNFHLLFGIAKLGKYIGKNKIFGAKLEVRLMRGVLRSTALCGLLTCRADACAWSSDL